MESIKESLYKNTVNRIKNDNSKIKYFIKIRKNDNNKNNIKIHYLL